MLSKKIFRAQLLFAKLSFNALFPCGALIARFGSRKGFYACVELWVHIAGGLTMQNASLISNFKNLHLK